ncbi:MAG: HAD family phosphatase [Prolixibacteraceae bacterium]|nr:HAD family phosphatase [Prolixibacteraceae bacterium]
MKFEAIIFDMDGVLVNSEPHYSRIEKENFKLLGLEISDEEHRMFQGSATDHMWRILKKKYGLKQSLEDLVEMTNRMIYPWFESLDTIETMPGVEELISYLQRKKIPLALASSSYPDVIELVLNKTGLKKYFCFTVNSTMVGKSKPAPDIFLLAAEKLKTKPENCMVIEDSTNGIKAAKEAGMYCVAYEGPGSEHQDQSKADRIIGDYSELIPLL